MRLLLLLLLVLSPVCVKAAQSGEKAPNIALHPTAQSVFQAHMLQDLQGKEARELSEHLHLSR